MYSITSPAPRISRVGLTSSPAPYALASLLAIMSGCANGSYTAGTGGKSGSGGKQGTGGGTSTGGTGTFGSGGNHSASGGSTSTGGTSSNSTGGNAGSGGGGGNGSGGAANTGGGSGTGGASSASGGVDGGTSSDAASTGGVDGAGGTAGTETGGSGAGGAATGGAGGTGFARRCGVVNALNYTVVAQSPVISDFTYTDGSNGVNASNFSFGDFTDTVSGYGFHYPDQAAAGGAGGSGSSGAGGAGGAAGPIGLKEDFTHSDWHVTGVVGNYSAFVVSLACATDASAFTGIEFTIKGNAGSPNRLTLHAAFAGNETGSTDVNNPGLGTCSGTCTAPSATVNLTSTATTVRLPWSSFTGGRPFNTVNPAQLVALRFTFAWTGATSATPYSVDVVVDDLHFMTATASPDGGTGN